MARKHGIRRLADILPATLREIPTPPVTWVARLPLLGIKPIVSSDPVIFYKIIAKLKTNYPNLKIYIFKVVTKD